MPHVSSNDCPWASCLHWQQEAVKYLLAHQCDIHSVACDSTNALHFAAQKGHTAVARHLITAGEPASILWQKKNHSFGAR